MDVGGVSLQDAYADFHWLSGIGLRVGQFKPPIGLEAGLEEHELKLVERSLLQRYWKPADPWDIGIAVRFERAAFDITGAIVNGSGRNSARDGNRWKDVCAQLNVRAFSSRLPVLSLRTYYGRVGGDGNEFVTFAAAVSAGVAGGEVLAELQHARVGASRRPSVHVQASRLLAPWVEVAGRFQVEVQPEDRYDGGLTGGLNLKPLGETLTIMLNYNYWRQASQHPQLRVSEHKVYIQVQLGL